MICISASLRAPRVLTRSLPLILPCRAPCGSLPSGFPSRLGRVSPRLISLRGLPSAGSVGSHSPEMSHPSGCLCSLPRNRPACDLRFATVASLAPAHLTLRAAYGRLPSQRPLACDLRFATVASFAPAQLALRAAFGRLPSQRPLACVQVSGFRFPVSPLPPFESSNAAGFDQKEKKVVK